MRLSTMRVSRGFALAVACSAAILEFSTAGLADAAPAATRTFVPIGSDYQAPTLERFALAAAQQDVSGRVVLLVLPITYSLNATTSKAGERQRNLSLADTRRQMVEDACNAVKASDQVCDVQLVPVLTRSDAFLDSNVAYFTADVDGIFILGGDQTVAMGVVADTPVEQQMTAAYNRGVVVSGTSAGDAVQSVNMINGFSGDNGPAESLQNGAIDFWSFDGPNDPSRGLIFGFPDLVSEQHVYEQGRLGRAINVAMTSGLPVLGMDAATGGPVLDESTLTDVVGFTSGVVVDPLTYAATGSFGGPQNTLSVRSLATHLIPPGGYGFDFSTMTPTIDGAAQPAPALGARSYPAITTPNAAGALYLSGGLLDDPTGEVAEKFTASSGGSGARLVVLAVGYRRATDAKADAKLLTTALQPRTWAPVVARVVNNKQDAARTANIVSDATGIIVTAPDAASVKKAMRDHQVEMGAVFDRWTSGKAALLADDAAAAVLGEHFVADPPPGADIDTESSEDFLAEGATVKPGLAWVHGLNLDARLLPDRQWGQLYHLAWTMPSTLAAGVDVGTALKVRNGSATTVGDSAVVVLDGRQAEVGTGTNDAMAAQWVMLDSFINGQLLAP
jgi:cyanophycinase-like exopeptidase